MLDHVKWEELKESADYAKHNGGLVSVRAVDLLDLLATHTPVVPPEPIAPVGPKAPIGPTIEFAIEDRPLSAEPFKVAASSNSNGKFTYEVLNGSARVIGDEVTALNPGLVTIRTTQAADGEFSPGQKDASFTVTEKVEPPSAKPFFEPVAEHSTVPDVPLTPAQPVTPVPHVTAPVVPATTPEPK